MLLPPKCILCGKVLHKDELDLCRTCRVEAPEYPQGKLKLQFIDSFAAVWYYDNDVRKSLIRYKFYRARHYAIGYGRLLAMKVQENLPEGLHCTVANGYLVQIMSKDANKRNGVRVMLDAFGIKPEEAVYFGDDYDDAESMQLCGIGVAVENAIPEVKAVADEIAKSNDADGVARWIESHILSK